MGNSQLDMDIVKRQTQGVSRSLVALFWISVPVIAYTICALATLWPAHAAVFNIPSGDVPALINAMNTANSNGEDNTINLAVGTYILTAVDNIFDGENGLPTITSTITINGAGADSTVIARGAGTPEFRIFRVARQALPPVFTGVLTLNGLTITGGANVFGGGIANSSTVILTNSIVTGNTAADPDGDGGGIYNDIGSTLRLINSTVSGNTADRDGGGILNALGGSVALTNSTVSDNTAARRGGGILNGSGSTLTLTNSTLSDNTAEEDNGGGIYNASGATATVSNSTLARNSIFSALVAGRGTAIANFGTMTVRHSTVALNLGLRASGAIANHGELTISNTILANNPFVNCSQLSSRLMSEGYNLSSDSTCDGLNQTGDQNDMPAGLDPSRAAGQWRPHQNNCGADEQSSR